MKEEIWKDVVGYEEYFQVSNLGNVFSKRTDRVLKQCTSKTGYKLLSTKIGGRNGIDICFRVHRLVAEAFLEPPTELLSSKAESTFYGKVLVNHIDGNKTNNCASNLEWCDNSSNILHAIDFGLIKHTKGLDNHNFILTRADVLFIKEHYIPYDREFGSRALGRKFGVSHSVVQDAYRMDI